MARALDLAQLRVDVIEARLSSPVPLSRSLGPPEELLEVFGRAFAHIEGHAHGLAVGASAHRFRIAASHGV